MLKNKLNMVSWMDAMSGDRDVLSDIAASTYHTEVPRPKIRFVFPQTGLLVGFYLRRKRDWTRWWARCAVLGADLLGALGWVGRGIWPCRARWAGLGVGFGSGGRAGLHVFFMSFHAVFDCLHVYLRCVSWGLSKTKPGIGKWNVVLSNSVFEKCDVKRTKWKQEEWNGSSGNQHSLKRTAQTTVQFSNYYITVSTHNTSWIELENELRVRNATSR